MKKQTNKIHNTGIETKLEKGDAEYKISRSQDRSFRNWADIEAHRSKKAGHQSR